MRHLIAAAAPLRASDAFPGADAPRSDGLVQSYRQLADVFHDILSEQSLDNLLERIADTLAELVPYDSLSIYQADEAQTVLCPVLARDQWADEILKSTSPFGRGITGWAALHREPVRTNQAHLDPRMTVVPGTPPDEPEALITVPLVARDTVKGALNIYRLGEHASFGDEEFELATRFADAAALALDNAQIRERLEHQAQTDSLTGLYNHRYFHERLRAELTRASRSRELVACAEAAMMTSKARGKNQIVLYDEDSTERPQSVTASTRDVRSIAHMKMLQGLAGKLNRLNDVRKIGEVIADELRLLMDYHNCRVSVIEGEDVVPIAFRGDLVSRDGERVDFPSVKIGTGITGHVAVTGEPLLVGNTLECEYSVTIPGTHVIEESQIAVPLRYGARVIGVVGISKLGVDQFDEDDVRLIEVLAGHASVALENARLYEAQRREADHLKALLEFTGAISEAGVPEEIGQETVLAAARLLSKDCALWLPDGRGNFRIAAHSDYHEKLELRPVLDVELGPDAGRAAIGARIEPFVLEASDANKAMPLPSGLSWPDLALAPLRTDDSVDASLVVREPAVCATGTE